MSKRAISVARSSSSRHVISEQGQKHPGHPQETDCFDGDDKDDVDQIDHRFDDVPQAKEAIARYVFHASPPSMIHFDPNI